MYWYSTNTDCTYRYIYTHTLSIHTTTVSTQPLVKYFESELSGNMQEMMIKMYTAKGEYDALELHRALEVSRLAGEHCTVYTSLDGSNAIRRYVVTCERWRVQILDGWRRTRNYIKRNEFILEHYLYYSFLNIHTMTYQIYLV